MPALIDAMSFFVSDFAQRSLSFNPFVIPVKCVGFGGFLFHANYNCCGEWFYFSSTTKQQWSTIQWGKTETAEAIVGRQCAASAASNAAIGFGHVISTVMQQGDSSLPG